MLRSRYFQAYGLWHAGEGFQTILLMWYMTFHAELSASQMGFYQALQLCPFLLFTVFGGSLTDRVGARVSFAASTGLFALTLGFYGLADPVLGFSPRLFGAYCLASGFFSALANPAIDTFIPEATPRPASDNALIAATVHNAAKLTGNGATLLLPALSAIGGFIANGVLMALSVVCLLGHRQAPASGRSGWQPPSLRRIVTHFRAHPDSFDIFLASLMLGAFVIPAFYVFLPLIMRAHFADHAGLFGLTGVMFWIGAILAAGLAVRAADRLARPGRWAMLVWLGVAVLLPVAGWVQTFAAYLAVNALLGGNSVGKALVYGHFLQDTPAGDRGLLIGLDQTAFWGLATLGTAALGRVVDEVGMERAIALNSLAIVAAVGALCWRGRLWRLGRAA